MPILRQSLADRQTARLEWRECRWRTKQHCVHELLSKLIRVLWHTRNSYKHQPLKFDRSFDTCILVSVFGTLLAMVVVPTALRHAVEEFGVAHFSLRYAPIDAVCRLAFQTLPGHHPSIACLCLSDPFFPISLDFVEEVVYRSATGQGCPHSRKHLQALIWGKARGRRPSDVDREYNGSERQCLLRQSLLVFIVAVVEHSGLRPKNNLGSPGRWMPEELMFEVSNVGRMRIKEQGWHSNPGPDLYTACPLEQWQAECAPGMTSVQDAVTIFAAAHCANIDRLSSRRAHPSIAALAGRYCPNLLQNSSLKLRLLARDSQSLALACQVCRPSHSCHCRAETTSTGISVRLFERLARQILSAAPRSCSLTVFRRNISNSMTVWISSQSFCFQTRDCNSATVLLTSTLIPGGPHTKTQVRRPVHSSLISFSMYGMSGLPHSVLQPVLRDLTAAGMNAKRIRFFWNSVGVDGNPKSNSWGFSTCADC
ncbi:hypothetical protein KC321_g6 [Hortaea werneckii]|nr:hypothetical protein KC321_g6 [Hortaea werneckii]